MISTVTTTITAVITAQVMAYSIIAVVFLIIFLALKEILSSETDRPSIKVVPERIRVANHTLTTCFRRLLFV